jgi:hypothetical protein
MAMKGDLLDFLAKYESTLASHDRRSTDQDPARIRGARNTALLHCKIGSAFQVFLKAFGREKMSLLHSKFAPPVCDKGSYSQLIYATCLALLRDAMDYDDGDLDICRDQNPEECREPPVQLVRSALAVFLLYAMYETNPLKRADDRIPMNPADRMISMLPTSLSYPREHMHFRRAFHRPIRVDVNTYRILAGTLPDLAVEQVAWCESARSRSSGRRLSPNPSTSDASPRRGNVESGGWRCTCAVAQDVLHVLRRLEPHWDLASYTGPCGLEAMAGHPDYARKAVVPNGVHSNIVNEEMAIDVDEAPREDFPLGKVDLTIKLREYLGSCSEIRFPVHTTQRIERVRESIRPIFGKTGGERNDGAPALSQLVQAALNDQAGRSQNSSVKTQSITIERRHVTFSVDVPNDREAALKSIQPPPDDRSENATNHGDVEVVDQLAEPAAALELALPNGISELEKQSLTDAVKTLLKRGDLSRGSGMLEAQGDDVSTLGATSAGDSRASGVGRNALQALLSQAGLPAESAATRRVVTNGDFFLGAMEDEELSRKDTRRLKKTVTNDGDEDGELSDLSDDGLSIAASAVGRKALDMLIAKSTQSGATTASASRRTEPRRSRTRRSTTKGIDEGDNDSDGESILFLEDASAAASTVGRKALTDLLLLGRGESRSEMDDDTSDVPMTGPTRQAPDSGSSVGSTRSHSSSGISPTKPQRSIPARARRTLTAEINGNPSVGRSKQRKAVPSASSTRVLRSNSKVAAYRHEDSSDGSVSMATAGDNDSIKCCGDTSRGAGQRALEDLLSSL